MTARDELQQWVDDIDRLYAEEGLSDATHEMMHVDLARQVLVEMDEAHTWDGIMSLLDEHYPTDIFPHFAGKPDNPDRDPGPRILSLIREVDRLRADAEGSGQ